MPTDTPDRLAGSPPAAGCPFSSSGPVFLFAFFLSPKQHWHAFQRWRDTFFAPFLPSAPSDYSGSGIALPHTHAHTHALFSLSPDANRRGKGACITIPRTFRSHILALDPGHGLTRFRFSSPLFPSTIVQHPQFFLLAQVTAIVIDSLAHHHSTEVVAQHHFPSAAVLLAAVVA